MRQLREQGRCVTSQSHSPIDVLLLTLLAAGNAVADDPFGNAQAVPEAPTGTGPKQTAERLDERRRLYLSAEREF
ncbi:hypothetical protein [Phytopseudomonas dryadis]|uniref:Uncharacterized protein n=1 Tax=Phytopseudomonas dryadis TaxID=2487520 RepID=A0A4Q9RAB2_9GAMM|nr:MULTISPECIES: hypothetical protein [Pseudomonas]TBU97685.1 hypothetical protein DNK44_01490 [Pseudomonas dryadis]TBV10140.1 hypothetical protein DNK34_01500 [Pseudomonas dryadis]TBV19029.1 hypothetical protein DNK41_04745 [Pseudomonas sp. FRB 230]